MYKYNYAKAQYGHEEIEAVSRCLRDGWLGSGQLTTEFEHQMARQFDRQFAVFVNSGSSALLALMRAFRFPADSEIITPACTFSTTLSSIVLSGYTPVFVDVNRYSFVAQVEDIENAISPKTVAVLIPNLVGSIPDMESIRRLCDHKGIIYIEDSADQIGGSYRERKDYSHAAITSFYASHHITACGGGGMVLTDDEDLAHKVRVLSSWGRLGLEENRFAKLLDGVRYDSKFTYDEVGFNFKPLEVQAAFGLEQLRKLSAFNATRQRNVALLEDVIARCAQLEAARVTPGAHVYWLAFPIAVRSQYKIVRTELTQHLETAGIQTRPLFSGNILRHPMFANIHNYRVSGKLTNADSIFRNCFLVGCHPEVDLPQIELLESQLESFLSCHV